ncbi:MAG: hypothetical protein RSE91_00625 [Bacilli bacterium]
MKEATGELNMTVIVIIAAAAILAFLAILLPKIFDSISKKWDDNADTDIGTGNITKSAYIIQGYAFSIPNDL